MAGLTWAEVDINNANQEGLMQLHGIGASKAKAIIAYRTENGGFVSVDELTEVRGIGKSLLKRNLESITLGEYGEDKSK